MRIVTEYSDGRFTTFKIGDVYHAKLSNGLMAQKPYRESAINLSIQGYLSKRMVKPKGMKYTGRKYYVKENKQ